MRNKAMERKLQSGEAIDLSDCPREHWYFLTHFIETVSAMDELLGKLKAQNSDASDLAAKYLQHMATALILIATLDSKEGSKIAFLALEHCGIKPKR